MAGKTNYFTVALKGIAMGAADVVPGVSGGTIAFIAGIYERLINAIKSIDLAALKLLFTGRFRALWEKIDGGFLFSLVAGIAVSIFSLARFMMWLLTDHPIATWSFFFGLIIASTIVVSRDVKRWNFATVAAMVAGAAAAYAITVVSPATTPDTWWFVIVSGAVAVCAMILPGISGSFILLLMGKYAYIIDAVANLRVDVLLLFIAGAVAGITAFSRLLSWLLARWRDVTVALLTGFMVGSLNKVWPWKETLETYADSHGQLHPLVEANVSPGAFEAITGGDPHLVQAIAMCVAGLLLIFVVEGVGRRVARRKGGGN